MSLLNKKGLQKWQKFFEDTMSAATFAEAGEHEMAREILKGQHHSPETVLLVVTGDRVNKRALDYATNLCKNTDCYLTVLQVTNSASNRTFDELKKQLLNALDIPWNFVWTEGPISKAVSGFLKQQIQVVSVILESRSKRQPTRRCSWWKNLYCPVVVV